jgi:hypothetical protein
VADAFDRHDFGHCDQSVKKLVRIARRQLKFDSQLLEPITCSVTLLLPVKDPKLVQ